MNMTEQSVMLSCYASGEILSARQSSIVALRATSPESEAFRSEARSAEKKKRQGRKQVPRVSCDVDRDMPVTETEQDFLHAVRK